MVDNEKIQEAKFEEVEQSVGMILEPGKIDFSKIDAKYIDESTDVTLEREHDPEKVKEAFDEQSKIIELVKETGRKICELGKRLIPFRDNRQWAYLGYNSFQEWYQDIGLSKTTIYRSISIYETFVLQFGLPEDEVFSKDIKKLDRILPLRNLKQEDGTPILNEETAEEWIDKCSLSETDLIKEINEQRGVKPELDRLEEDENLFKGTYVLVKTTENVSELRQLSSKKLPVEFYKNAEGDFVVRVI